MKKFKENNPIDIIEALCQMGNTEIYLYYIGD